MKLRKIGWVAGTSTLAVTGLATWSPAAAQTMDEANVDEGIIVTAQKREERLQDVPISMTVLSGESLEAQGLGQFIALQARVPNLSITDTPANASIFIRGIGTSGNNLSFEQSVALFVDQVYGGRNRQFMQPFFDVERVEVLRGPQGALFGRNTSAGAISLTSRRPTQELEISALTEFETVRNSFNIQSAASGPITDDLAVRVAVRYGDANGWIDNVVLDRKEPQREDILARFSVVYEPAENFSLFAKIEYGDNEIIGAPFEFVPFGTQPDYEVNTDDGLAPLVDISDSLNGTLHMDLGLGEHTLTSITAFSEYTYDQAFNIQARSPARLVTVNGEDFEQFSQELRLASPIRETFDYIVGGYYEWSESNIRRTSLLDLPFPPALNTDNSRTFDQTTEVLAAFGQINWSPTEEITIGAGLRWTRIEKEGRVRGVVRTFRPNGTFTDAPRNPLDAIFAESGFEPTLTVNWAPNPDVNLYAKYARGTKGGAFTEAALRVDEFILNPESADSYELGAKFQIPSLRGFVNLAAFSTDYTNLQKSTLDVDTATFITSNAAGARTRGIELDASFRPTASITISMAGAYLDAEYTDYPNGPCVFGAPATCTSQDRSGSRLQNAPTWTGNVGVNLDQPVSNSLRILGNWTTNYQSEINYQDILSPLQAQEGFTKTDVRVGVADIDDAWELALLVRNLFDRETSGIIFSTFPVGVGPNDTVHLPDPLRSITLQARLKF